jgi:DNA-binding response OmpR family regulator
MAAADSMAVQAPAENVAEATAPVALKISITPKAPLDDQWWYKTAQSAARFMMMLRSVNLSYRSQRSMALPGFMPNVGDMFGQRTGDIMSPGLDFAFGLTGDSYVDKALDNGWLLCNESVATPSTSQMTEDFQLRATLEPVRDLKIDLNATRTQSRSRSVQFMYQGMPTTYSGTFTMTTLSLGSAFEGMGNANNGYHSATFDRFLEAIPQFRDRVQALYPASPTSPTSSTSSTSPSTPVIPGEKEKLLPPPTEEEAAASEEEAAASVLRVLVVEDNRDVAEYIGSVLQPDYEVVYASDGAEGLAKAEELVPDVILTDVMMPGMDGLELCRRIRANLVTDHIPVIVITARVTDDDRLKGIEAGADAYLTKPFRADELLLRMAKILEQRKRLKEKLQSAPSVQEAPSPILQPTKGEQNASAFLQKLDEIILRQMSKGDIRTTAVANEMCMSLSQFARKLNSVAATSPAAYITKRRLEEACRMLEKSPKRIADVATSCGFADVSHFSHAFHRAYGISPTQYMEKCINS